MKFSLMQILIMTCQFANIPCADGKNPTQLLREVPNSHLVAVQRGILADCSLLLTLELSVTPSLLALSFLRHTASLAFYRGRADADSDPLGLGRSLRSLYKVAVQRHR